MSGTLDGELQRKMSEYRSRERVYVAALIEQEAELFRLRRAASDTLGACGDVAQAALQNALYDPASNMEVLLLRERIRERDSQISDLRQELEANSFDQKAPAGQALMKKCRLLLEENHELGEQLREDRMQQLRAVLLEEQRVNAGFVDRVRESADFCKVLSEENDKLQGSVSRVAGKLREAQAELKQHQSERGEAKKRRRQQREVAAAAAADAAPTTMILPVPIPSAGAGALPAPVPSGAPVVATVPDAPLCISDSPTFAEPPGEHKKAKKAKKEHSHSPGGGDRDKQQREREELKAKEDSAAASQALQAADALAIAKDFFRKEGGDPAAPAPEEAEGPA